MVLPESLTGDETDADNRAFHQELLDRHPDLGLPAVTPGGAGHLGWHEAFAAAVPSLGLRTVLAEGDPGHFTVDHAAIHIWSNAEVGAAGDATLPATLPFALA